MPERDVRVVGAEQRVVDRAVGVARDAEACELVGEVVHLVGEVARLHDQRRAARAAARALSRPARAARDASCIGTLVEPASTATQDQRHDEPRLRHRRAAATRAS